jgi:hypothetical protein
LSIHHRVDGFLALSFHPLAGRGLEIILARIGLSGINLLKGMLATALLGGFATSVFLGPACGYLALPLA